MSMAGFVLSVEMVCGPGARPLGSYSLLDKPLTLPVTQLPCGMELITAPGLKLELGESVLPMF